MLPVTTHPPSARDRSARRERRPERVVAVTVTIEPMPSGAVSITRTRWPMRLPGCTVIQTMFSCRVSGPTSGAKIRPWCREDQTAG